MFLTKVLVVAGCTLVSSVVAATDRQTPVRLTDNDSTGPKDGIVQTYGLPGCSNDTITGKGKTWSTPPDNCLKVTTVTSFLVLEPAICPNGTQALLARYEGRDCNYGKVTIDGGLVDLTDDDIGECQKTSPEGFKPDETHASVASFGWFCEGRKSSRPDENGGHRPKRGSVSLNTCRRPGERPRAPTFSHLYAGNCKTIVRNNQMEIFHRATCADGTDAKLATWYGNRICKGSYDKLDEIGEDTIKSCFTVNTESHSSFAFWCPESKTSNAATPRGVLQKSSSVLFIAGFWLLVLLG